MTNLLNLVFQYLIILVYKISFFLLQFCHSCVAPANYLQFISDMFHNSSDGSELLLSAIVSPVVCAVSEDSDVVHLVLVLVGDAVVTSIILPQQKWTSWLPSQNILTFLYTNQSLGKVLKIPKNSNFLVYQLPVIFGTFPYFEGAWYIPCAPWFHDSSADHEDLSCWTWVSSQWASHQSCWCLQVLIIPPADNEDGFLKMFLRKWNSLNIF